MTTELEILRHLSRADGGRATVDQLAQSLDVPRQDIADQLRRMHARGWIGAYTNGGALTIYALTDESN